MKYLISLFLLSPILIFSQITEEMRGAKNRQINFQIGAGVEYANNSEIGIFGQYNLNDNISFIGKVRNCTHDDDVYFSPGIKYYFNKTFNDIVPFIDIRYEKLHYDLKWSGYTYGFDRRYNPFTDQYEFYQTTTAKSGSTIINEQALSLSGGGEFIINNFGVNTGIGLSYFTKTEGDSDKKTNLSFTISVLYYFNK